MDLLNSMASDAKESKEVITSLPMLDKCKKIRFSYDESKLNRIRSGLSKCKNIVLDSSRIEHVSLIESFESATIEGARTTINEVIRGVNKDKSFNMVVNCLAGMQYIINENKINKDTLIRCWEIVVKDCCENVNAGCDGFRTGMVYIGSSTRIVHAPALPEDIDYFISSMLEYTSGDKILDSIIYHFYFVYVHPFCDGNGRIARILNTFMLGVYGLPLSKAIRSTINRYYTYLEICEKSGDISLYIDYMFNIISLAVDMYKLYSYELSSNESLLLSKIDVIGKGEVSISKAAKIMNVNELEASDILKGLIDKGYLEFNDSDNTFKLLWR